MYVNRYVIEELQAVKVINKHNRVCVSSNLVGLMFI